MGLNNRRRKIGGVVLDRPSADLTVCDSGHPGIGNAIDTAGTFNWRTWLADNRVHADRPSNSTPSWHLSFFFGRQNDEGVNPASNRAFGPQLPC